MTHEQATELVEDLIQTYYDYEGSTKPSYRDEYLAMKQKVIDALTDHDQEAVA